MIEKPAKEVTALGCTVLVGEHGKWSEYPSPATGDGLSHAVLLRTKPNGLICSMFT
jgi:hypothetical protein